MTPQALHPLRLHLNENTAGCSPAVLSALRSVTREDVACYPDYGDVTAACARWFRVPDNWVQLTNGLDEGLHLVAQYGRRVQDERHAAARDKGEAIVVEPAFEMYALCADAAGLQTRSVAPLPQFRFPIDELTAAITPATRVIYLTDPNNPTGLPMPGGAAEHIAAAAPAAIVLVDEAYADFSGRSIIGPTLDTHRNLVVGRTFAKGHGLAGLRIGALVAHPETLAPMRPLLPPFNLNVFAAVALRAALAERAYLQASVMAAAASRELIYAWCRRHGIVSWPSEGNFVLMRIGEPTRVIVDTLAARGIRVRDRSTAPGCAGCIRVTAGVVEHTEICLAALEAALATRTR